MGYCYARRVSAPESQITAELKEELYTAPYASIDWQAQRSNVAPGDIYTPHSTALNIVFSESIPTSTKLCHVTVWDSRRSGNKSSESSL